MMQFSAQKVQQIIDARKRNVRRLLFLAKGLTPDEFFYIQATNEDTYLTDGCIENLMYLLRHNSPEDEEAHAEIRRALIYEKFMYLAIPEYDV